MGTSALSRTLLTPQLGAHGGACSAVRLVFAASRALEKKKLQPPSSLNMKPARAQKASGGAHTCAV